MECTVRESAPSKSNNTETVREEAFLVEMEEGREELSFCQVAGCS